MPLCIFCDSELTDDTKPEHILLNALGGRKTTRRVICSKHNGDFGKTVDKVLAEQMEEIRNLLQLDSGTRQSPPMLRNVKSGTETINIKADGTPELVGKPFTITQHADGLYDLSIMARSLEQLNQLVPHIAAQLRCPEERVREIIKSCSGSIITKRPDTIHFGLSFGGEEALRSVSKSCLELWALAAGNEEVRSTPYEEARRFAVVGGNGFNKTRINLDSRYLPHSDQLKPKFGELFNLFYVRSDDAGRVVGHFTLYNIISWQIVLAERGGRPNTKIGLISNPLDPSVWSDSVADDFDIEFTWLDNPDYSDKFERARERIITMMKLYQSRATASEIEKIVDGAFDRVEASEGVAIGNNAWNQIVWDISGRLATLVLRLPHEQRLTPADIAAMLKGGKKSS